MDWIFGYVTSDQSPETILSTGAIIAGRRTYEVGQRDTGKETGQAYGGAWSGPQFILTHRPPDHLPNSGPTFLTGTVGEAVATALQAADGKNVEIFGGNLGSQCLTLGLVDEIVVRIAPVLLGDGTRLFAVAGGDRISLELISTQTTVVTSSRYRVINKPRA